MTVDGCALLGAESGCVAEEPLHLAGRGEDDQHAGGCGANRSEGMRDSARAEDRFSGFELYSSVANLKKDFAFDDVEPLILFEVEMNGRAAG